ncbi:MAG: N-acetylmuramoyl-L-alanine amidase [Bacteroidales bacterium]|nr:N-acetylmuramoyl-L-alanine amidase [Bacteroidales bacterium]
MTIKICLDAGHYGNYNQSPAVKSYYEAQMTWKLQNYLKIALESYGIQVITTRDRQEVDRALYDRGACSKGCDLFLSLHSNAVGGYINESVDYPVAYVLLNGKSTALGLKLATIVAKTIGTSQPARTATRQGTNGEYYGVLRGANAVGVPGIILEHSFHTNTKITKWLLVDKNLQTIAQEEAACIAEYFGFTKITMTNTDAVPFVVKVSIPDLIIRKGAGTNTPKTGKYTGIGSFTITEVKSGKGSTKGWGKLKSGAGWIALDYVTVI